MQYYAMTDGPVVFCMLGGEIFFFAISEKVSAWNAFNFD